MKSTLIEKNKSLESFGVKPHGKIYWNLSTPALYEEAINRNEGLTGKYGPIVVNTSPFTGRSPKDKFIVKDSVTADKVWWGKINQPIDEEKFIQLKKLILEHLQRKDLFVKDCYVGADDRYRITLRIISERAIGAFFAGTMFIQENDLKKLENFTPEFTVLHAPSLNADPKVHGTNSGTFIVLNFKEKLILIGGTSYAGEIKKSMFSVMNYLLPQKGIMPMHASANYGKDENDTAIFFGLSGTGKTTLSADPDRTLIGDDEHGWSDHGVFNFEGGCYAKVIKLSEKTEPEIYETTKRFGTMLENVVIDPLTREIDLNSDSITENTRGSYPVSFIPNMTLKGTAGHPKNIIMLTCDAFGVLPPISKLTFEQAMYHFISGYTAKVAGTERGITEPQATFSPCFGGPFMALHPQIYAKLLGEKIKNHSVDVWLINTGWSGGPYGTGSRMKLPLTRAMIKAVLDGSLKNIETKTDPIFGVNIPVLCPGVPAEILQPKNTWKDPAAYDKKAKELMEMFEKNFKEYG
ncbi:MAG: phosphoenolpyruvate carboxykinase (ATP) [Candidatus Melainabacteria bacterium RIFCSPLOWO2_02_FULL_35_15]|nr:MAG: phosphoenolpyruvate carboxykinase (ATP) [Candidatus Melainabacteria bacterium RIFCSPLOWO2_12_FULL_35_11]OGI13260.1 MAG: phosphoenolpyruvate carboxykinase (ATP) [Candidatus Melainabacteria bacterium RIFCSPLOWO2_02_FULL_35_15]